MHSCACARSDALPPFAALPRTTGVEPLQTALPRLFGLLAAVKPRKDVTSSVYVALTAQLLLPSSFHRDSRLTDRPLVTPASACASGAIITLIWHIKQTKVTFPGLLAIKWWCWNANRGSLIRKLRLGVPGNKSQVIILKGVGARI